MVAKLWAQQIIANNKSYPQVPRMLKEPVKAVLIEWGYEEMIAE